MGYELGLALAALLILGGAAAWFHRRGAIAARYRAARDELRKLREIQQEGQRIDDETKDQLDRLVHDHDDGLRRFWLRDD